MDKGISQRMETSATDLRRQFRDNKIKFNNLNLSNNTITVQFANNADRDTAADFLRRNGNEFTTSRRLQQHRRNLKLNYTDARRQKSSLMR